MSVSKAIITYLTRFDKYPFFFRGAEARFWIFLTRSSRRLWASCHGTVQQNFSAGHVVVLWSQEFFDQPYVMQAFFESTYANCAESLKEFLLTRTSDLRVCYVPLSKKGESLLRRSRRLRAELNGAAHVCLFDTSILGFNKQYFRPLLLALQLAWILKNKSNTIAFLWDPNPALLVRALAFSFFGGKVWSPVFANSTLPATLRACGFFTSPFPGPSISNSWIDTYHFASPLSQRPFDYAFPTWNKSPREKYMRVVRLTLEQGKQKVLQDPSPQYKYGAYLRSLREAKCVIVANWSWINFWRYSQKYFPREIVTGRCVEAISQGCLLAALDTAPLADAFLPWIHYIPLSGNASEDANLLARLDLKSEKMQLMATRAQTVLFERVRNAEFWHDAWPELLRPD